MPDSRGLPLLSGPPPPVDSSRAELGCRKCNKEFNVIFTRSRRCYHCGYSYCHNCSDFQALLPRTGHEPGYDAKSVCAYCIEYLTRATQIHATGKLRKYANAYNIKISHAVEKDDLIDALVNARGNNRCLLPQYENYYRTYSVPTSDRPGDARTRGIFSPQQQRYAPPPGPPPSNQRPPPPPHPNQYHSPPPQPPHPNQYHSSPPTSPTTSNNTPLFSTRITLPATIYAIRASTTSTTTPATPIPYAPRTIPSCRWGAPYQQPSASRSTHDIPQPAVSPRPRATSATPPVPPPSLDQLLDMTAEAISGLSIHSLKAILFTNHVNAGLILEKSELVKKVQGLVNDERRERERQRLVEEQEEREQIERQRQMFEEHRRAQQAKEEAEEQAAREEMASCEDNDDAHDDGGDKPSGSTASPPSSPPKASGMAPNLERTGLCVICQDDEANIAIVDCGHLAMCRGCSDLVMASSRECPLCRTRIVTEARLLRIFKT
ncbi:hypothetical protein BD779DRAFT_1524005 [Infundibulicybe gibba]|nr:hypothetical protein BD779DRAFT_1524005 [Infundibulicybe gibba]